MIPPPGLHGGDGAAIARALGLPISDVLDLSMTLNPCAPDIRPVLARHLDAVGRYPDPARATDALRERLGRAVLLTNGGAEAIALVASHLGRVSIVEPEFSLWRRHATIAAGAPIARSNPNNPTGLLAGPDEAAAVWDEAFFPLATGTWTRGDGDWVVGSLTKLLACPGLRIGYVIGDIAALRPPAWSVNALACSALPELLDAVDLPVWSKQVAVLRDQLTEVLHAAGLPVRPSDAPWVLVDEPLRERLAERAIAVRDCASFGLPGVTRIAVPDDAGLALLEAALR